MKLVKILLTPPIVAISVAFCSAANAANLSEYVQTGLVAMWDGYRNQGADKPHDGTATNWLDTTGTHAFEFYRVFPGELGLKFSRYQHGGYALLSEESTQATFAHAASGTVEVVYWHYFQTGCTIVRSSLASGVLISNDGGLRTGAQKGSVKMAWPKLNRLHTVSARYDSAVSASVALDGTVLETSSTYGSTVNLGATTYLGYNQSFDGIIYAIRVYNRKLTDVELARNAALDQERYNHRKIKPTSEYPTIDYAADITADKIIEATPETGVNAAHDAAVAYVSENPGVKVLVKLSAGTYVMTAPIEMAAGEMIVGEGRDKTLLDGSDPAVSDAEYAIRLKNADNLVRGVAVINIDEITKTGVSPHAFHAKAGVVDSCRAAFIRAQYNGGGYGFWLQGGTVTNSLADHIVMSDQINYGICAKVESGLLTGCELCETDTNCDRKSYGSGLHVSGTGRVTHCRIHDCGQAFPYYAENWGAVYIDGGTVENCLIYENLSGNNGDDAKMPAGVYMKNGTMHYCTIANNTTFNDGMGYSGLMQDGGTVVNCIFMRNGVANNGVVVTGGTFVNNLVDKAVTGRDGNLVADTAYFNDLGAADFHIAARASLAVGKAAPQADVTVDFDDVVRSEDAPTIGAYEYVNAGGQFTADILIGQPIWRIGSSPTAELAVGGVTDESKLTVSWYVDEEVVPELENQLKPSFSGLDAGHHTIGATAAYGAETISKAVTNAFALLPVRVFVNKTGSRRFPYATEETGTDSPSDAYAALWKSSSETTTVVLASGAYVLSAPFNVAEPVEIFGAGAYETYLDGSALSASPLVLSHAGAVVRDLAVFGSNGKRGIEMSEGTVRNCLISNCWNNADGGGGGVRMTGGRLLDSEITKCHSIQMSTYGGGVAVCGANAVVSNCCIHGNFVTYGHGNDGVFGGGLYLRQGLVTHCRIVDNVDSRLKDHNGSTGSGICVDGQNATPCILRDSLIAHNSSTYAEAVTFRGGTVENCTVVDNLMTAQSVNATTEKSAVRVYRASLIGGALAAMKMQNTVIWGNGTMTNDIPRTGETAANIGYCCWAEAEEGVDGNTAKDPKFRVGKNKGQGVISSYGSCFRAGAVLDWMDGATDLRGNPRLTDGQVDIGCYQVGFDPGLMLLVK